MISAPAAARLIVCVAAVLPYLPALDDYFVQDDFGVVWLLSAKPWSAFPGWFVTTWMDDIWEYTPDEIRPFPAVTYQVAALWGAGSPLANHVMNVALHAANGVLVLAIARAAAGIGLAGATIAGLAFVLLPNGAESVAWVTGRVDSLPALVYLGAFLAYVRWRHGGGARVYWAAVVLCFVALFSKQTAITLGPALVLYDVVVGGRPVRPSWEWLRPYLPFAALTLGYLALRYAVFGEVARESQLTAAGLEFFGTLVVRHLHRVMFGDAAGGSPVLWAVAAAVLAVAWRARPRATLYFGVIWFAVHVAPVLVAAYESPRHVYLASVAWAMAIGLAVETAPLGRKTRVLACGAAAAALVWYAVMLSAVVSDWGARGLVSRKAVVDLEREARSAVPGTLIVASAPVGSWEWAAPFVLRRPFASDDLESRVRLVTPQLLHCCRAQWEEFTRARLREWLTSPDRPPAIALRWEARTGRLFRLAERDEPYLRPLLEVLAATDSAAALDRGILELGERLPPEP